MRQKKGKCCLVVCSYGRFLSINNPTIAIAATMTTVEIAKYISVWGKATTGSGDGVGAAAFTTKLVSAWDGQ